MSIGFLFYFPTLLQLKLQWKTYKIISRTLLGVGSGLFLLSCVLLSPISLTGLVIRCMGIAFFMAVAKFSLNLRSKHTNSPCINCPEGSFPYCSYKLPELELIAASGSLEEAPQHFIMNIITQLSN